MAILPGFLPQLKPGVKNAVGAVNVLPVTKKPMPKETPAAIQSAVKPGVIGAFGKVTSPAEVKAVQPQVQAENKIQSADLIKNLGELDDKEIAFMNKAKESGYTKEETAKYIADKRNSFGAKIDRLDIPNIIPFQDQIEGAAKKGVKSLLKVGEEIKQSASDRMDAAAGMGERAGYSAPLEAIGAIGQGAGFASDVIGAFLKEGASAADKMIGGAGSKALQGISQTKEGKAGLEALSKGIDVYNQWAEKNPRASLAVEALGNVADLGLNFVGGKAVEQGAKVAAEEIASAGAKTAVKNVAADTAKVLDLIKEPLTPGNKELAGVFGRLKTPTKNFFTTSKVQITPGDRIARAADVIATKVKPTSLTPEGVYADIKTYIGKESDNLANNLKQIRTKSFANDISKTQKELLDLTVSQSDLLPDESKQIKALIRDIAKAKDANDIWEIRKLYDDLTPARVKDKFGTRDYDIWMKNRTKLNNLLDKMVRDVGDVGTKDIFADMTSLYEAQKNLKYLFRTAKDIPATAGNLFSTKNIVKGAATAAGLGVLGNLF